MILQTISRDQKERARLRFDFHNLPGSITKGVSNIYGALGEVIVKDYFKERYIIEDKSSLNYDLIINGLKVDVKTKKIFKAPRPDYRVNIPARSKGQKTDFYFFLYIFGDLSRAYLAGYISKERFFNSARFCKAGEEDRGGWTFKTDCYTLTAADLQPFKLITP